MMTMTAVATTSAHHHGDVALDAAWHGELAHPGEGEDLLDDDGAAEEADELHGEDREGGAAGVAQHVLVDDAVGVESAAAERADVVARHARRSPSRAPAA